MVPLVRSNLQRGLVWLLIGLLSLAAVLLPASGAMLGRAGEHPDVPAGSQTLLVPLDQKPQGLVIHAGLQVKNIYDLSLAAQSFMADGWYWLSWDDAVQAVLETFKIEPTQIVEFTNEIEPAQYSFSEVLPEEIKLDPESTHSVYVKFSGKFYINEVAQKQAPFDRQRLEIAIEVKPSQLSEGSTRIELIPVPIKQLPISGEYTSVSGFSLMGTDWSRQAVRYIEPISQQGAAPLPRVMQPGTTYSRATAVFTYAPDPWTVFLKWLLPLIAVMGIVILAPSIDGALGDVRLAIPSAALLTLVVLHDGYKANFPPAPYMTYLDEIYTYSYIVCFAIFLLFLVGTNAHSRSSDSEREAVTSRVNRLDLIVQVSTMAGFLIVASVGWFS